MKGHSLAMRAGLPVGLALLAGGCGQSERQRYQSIPAQSGYPLMILDTVTGCLDVVGMNEGHLSVRAIEWYPDQANAAYNKVRALKLKAKGDPFGDLDAAAVGAPAVPVSPTHSCVGPSQRAGGTVQ